MKINKHSTLHIFFIIIFAYQLNAQVNFQRNDIINLSSSNVGFEEIAVADIDGDGDLDIVTASRNDNKIAWYENTDGLGTFGPQQNISIIATSANSIFIVDIDGDNDMDVLFSGAFVAWFENIDGLGTFGTPQVIQTTGASSVHAADIDGDNFIDVLVAATNIRWYKNINGQGVFGMANNLTNDLNICSDFDGTCISPVVVADIFAGDIDNDGDIDIVACADGTNDDPLDFILVYENTDGNGTFSNRVAWSLTGFPRSVHLFDGDGDSDLDIFFSSNEGNESLWIENKDGLGDFATWSYNNPWLHAWGQSIESFYPTDLDNNGIVDILYAEGNSSGSGDNSIGYVLNGINYVLDSTLNKVSSITSGDIDDDGEIDIIHASFPGIISWYRNTSNSLGVDEYNEAKISIFPNPTDDKINIVSKNNISQIKIYNGIGQLVLSNFNKSQINVTGLESGLYFCEIKDENGNIKVSKTIIK